MALTPQIAGTSQPAFSEHLSVLSRAGLVDARPQGRERIYSLNAGPLAEAFDWLKPYEAFGDERLARLGDGRAIRPAPMLSVFAVRVHTTRETVSRRSTATPAAPFSAS